MHNNDFNDERARMVALLEDKGIQDKKVLEAMLKVQRHLFVPQPSLYNAYGDHALEIGYGQTISQPYIVALMIGAARLRASSKVLEIGTGSGYQAAILGEICKKVYTVEIIKPLVESAKERLKALKYKNIHVKAVDGHEGWPEKAPFDAVIVTASTTEPPPALIKQLKVRGTLIIPLKDGKFSQKLMRITKINAHNTYIAEELEDVRFVPLFGN